MRSKLFSFIVVVTFSLFTHDLSFLFISKGFDEFVPQIKLIWNKCFAFYEPVVLFIHGIFMSIGKTIGS